MLTSEYNYETELNVVRREGREEGVLNGKVKNRAVKLARKLS